MSQSVLSPDRGEADARVRGHSTEAEPTAMMPALARAELDLSIVVPIHNESGNIGPLVAEIGEVLGSADIRYELILVDDGSTDGSRADMLAAAALDDRVRCLRHTVRCGKSAALWTGFRSARGAWIQTLDGDRQNDPADVRALWQRFRQEPPAATLGLVAGQRQRRHDGLVKWVSSRVANGVRRTLLRDGTPDTACGFKMLRREAMASLILFDGMHRFLPALVRRGGWDVLQVPVNDRPRTAAQSKYGFFGRLGAGVADLVGVVWLMRRSTLPPDLRAPSRSPQPESAQVSSPAHHPPAGPNQTSVYTAAHNPANAPAHTPAHTQAHTQAGQVR